MKQPFRVAGELPLVEIPKKEKIKINWGKFFERTMFTILAVVAGLLFIFLGYVCYSVYQDGKYKAAEQERINIRYAQCTAWGSIDRETCETCLKVSSTYPDVRCATINRWNIKQ